jgi:hypothetical protein
MININRCTLCHPINFNEIVETGIILPLEPHSTAWQKEQSPCGLCALIYHSLRLGLSEKMDTLLLRYNAHAGVVVVAATTHEFKQTSILPKLLCGEHGETWFHEAYKYKSEFTCAFLSTNLGTGM